MVVDATSPILKRNAVQRLVNPHAKWQSRVHLKPVMRLVDECVFEGDTKMQPAWARFTEHALALDRGPRRFDASDANVKETAPAGDVGEQLPHDADRRLDDLSGTSQVIRRGHGERVSSVMAERHGPATAASEFVMGTNTLGCRLKLVPDAEEVGEIGERGSLGFPVL